MKKKLIISLIAITLSAIYAGAFLTNFSVKSQDGDVIITWQTSSETDVKNFVIQRSTIKGGWIDIATVEPEADHNYEYVDQSAYKTTDTIYYYQLKIVDYNGSITYSNKETVAHSVSSVKRTWGSIKALFR
jgi:hypothetical protein